MSAEMITKDDLEIFRIQLMDDIRRIIAPAQKIEQQPQWLKSNEVRKIIKASPGTLQNLRIAGKLNPIKIGGTWYYSLSEINALFQKSK